MASHCWRYFSLLLWKNFLLKVRHKMEFFVEIAIPVFFCSLLLIIRSFVVPEVTEKPTIYEECGISDLNPFFKNKPIALKLYELDYYPNKNPLIQNLVHETAKGFGMTIRGFDNIKEMEKFMLNNQSLAGIIFDGQWSDTEYPKRLDFRLRFPGSLRTSHNFVQLNTWSTEKQFPIRHLDGPRNRNETDGGLPPGYIREGFIAIQNAISKNFVRLVAAERKRIGDDIPEIVLRRYPYPPYHEDQLLMALESVSAVIVILSFVYPCVQAVKHVTHEKESQLREAMQIMGLSWGINCAAWFFTLWICLVVTSFFIVVIVKVPWFNHFTASVLTHTSWSILFVYMAIYSMATIAYAFMISSFFISANVAAAVGGLVWFTLYIPYSLSIHNFVEMSLRSKLGLSIFLNSALPFGFRLILKWEAINDGAQWHNIFKPANFEEPLCLGHVMGMMILDTIVYMLIASYAEMVLPVGYGTPRKWYFLCTKDFWCRRRHVDIFDEDIEESILDPDRFEPETDFTRKTGIRLVNLRKLYEKKVIVNRLSMRMYEDQITVLLGHNGAGKTTTISMITGLIPPTSGTAIINGMNILKNLSEIRQSLGFCPQHNILFDRLTVREHIIFYSRLKGLRKDRIPHEVNKYLQLLELENKRNAEARTLSGGMKRRLSVGVAFCGDSKIVLCDEPSSGMDPAARRSLWDLLLKEKRGRTVLLTTHFMDEADILGDRIAIMSLGSLACSGTPFFLKKRFGAGYQLICNKGDNCKPDRVTKLLRKYISEIEVKSDVGRELSYRLPEKYVGIFEVMLEDLEAHENELHLDGYGISMTTLEDVFMATGSDLTSKIIESGENFSENSIDIYIEDPAKLNTPKGRSVNLVGQVMLMQYHWRAMFLKKYYYFVRNWYIFFIQLLIPLLFIMLSVYVSKSMVPKSEQPPITIELDTYMHDTITLLEVYEANGTIGSRIAENYAKLISFKSRHAVKKIKEPIISKIIKLEEKNLLVADTQYMVAATVTSSKITGWFNNEVLHTAPLTLNLIWNAIAKTILGSEYSIQVTNYPLPYSLAFRLLLLKNTTFLGFQLALNMSFSMSFVSAMFVMFLIKERESRAKLLQFVSGVRAITFWTTHLIWDFLIYFIITVFVVLLMFIFQQEGFSTHSDLGRIFLVFIVYGLSSLPFTYLVSFFYNDASAGLTRLVIYNVFTGNGLFIICFVLYLPVVNMASTADLLQEIFLIFPNFALAQALSNQATLATVKSICNTASNIMHMPMHTICMLALPECCKLKPYGWSNPGIGKLLVYMVSVNAFFFVILLIVEFFSRRIYRKINKLFRPPLPEVPKNEDDDVQRERKRVNEMDNDEIDQQNLVLRDATKYYGKFLAVNRLSLGLEPGEGFGLLGINGAGKTTTFKMLTNDTPLTYGDIWIRGYNTKTAMNVIYEMIGYCPQFDGLFMDLTGYETLRIFSMLRGIPMSDIDMAIKESAKQLAFDKHLHKKISEYSGGNRRKLSTAVALLGNPRIVYLDEPTTGIDPASRRRLWDIICQVRDRGKGVILTSHSMEECEALCTRIAIVVNGELKCLGSTQHLKNKFSKGITVSVKLKQEQNGIEYYNQLPRPTMDIFRTSIKLDTNGINVYNFFIRNFEGAILKDCHKNLLEFVIPFHTMPYSRIFGLMESNKEDLHIEDYSITQATLEQIFIDFIRDQRQETTKKHDKND